MIKRVNWLQFAAWAGMVGPALFVAIFTLEGWLRPGYDARSTYISELSIGPRGWIQIANFVVFGILFFIFTRAVIAEFPNGKSARAGPILLTIIAICFLVSGPFVTDPASTPRDQMSVHGLLHAIFGAVVFSLSPISCFVFLRRFRADPEWQSFQGWTLAAGVIMLAAVILLRVGPTTPPAPPSAFNAWAGAIQRTALIPYLIWVFTFALTLYRHHKQGQNWAEPKTTPI